MSDGALVVTTVAAGSGLMLSDDDGVSFHAAHVDGPCYTDPAEYPIPAAGLALVHLDEAVAVVEKPAFLPTENTRHLKDSARSRLEALLAERGEPSELRLPHRLDWETSGLLVFARTAEAMRSLASQFAARTVRKAYFADVVGRPPAGRGVVELPLAADAARLPLQRVDFGDGGKAARTSWEVVRELGAGDGPCEACRLRLSPETGRRHQLRVHCLALGCPMAGDALYLPACRGAAAGDSGGGGAGGRRTAARLHLHAAELGFEHPESGQALSFSSEPPFRLEQAV